MSVPETKYAVQYLLERGIDPEFAVTEGVEIQTAQTEWSRSVYRLRGIADSWAGKALPDIIEEALWFPAANQSWILRGFPAPIDKEGKPAKFLSPREGSGPPFIPRAISEVRKQTDSPIIITEGPPKALVLNQAGFHAIALAGVWMASNRNGQNRFSLRPELQEIRWLGRKVYLCFDADQQSNPDVLHALVRLAFVLNIAGAELWQLTTWPAAEGKGIDDYLVGKAGRDEVKQKNEVEALISRAQLFFPSLRPYMLSLVEAELAAVAMSDAQRSQFCKLLAGPLGVKVSALEEQSFDNAELSKARGRIEEVIEPWPEAVDGAKLLQTIFGTLQRFVVITDPEFITTSLWIVFVYVYELFPKLPILRLKSPTKQCGKSTLIDAIELLVVKPLVTVSVSPSALYRTIEKFHPTILIDEADSYGKDNDDLRNIVNGGFERNRPAIRTNKESLEPEFFDTFGPKLLASIGPLHETIEDRSVTISMKRKPSECDVEELCDADPGVFLELRRKIQRWANDNKEKLKATRLVRPKALGNRLWNKWRPLLTIAAVVDGSSEETIEKGHWYKVALAAAIGIAKEHDEERGISIEILDHLRTLFRKSGQEFITTIDVLFDLNNDSEAPWANWKSGEKTGLTAEKLAKRLKAFGIKSEKHQMDNKEARGYFTKPFEPVFASYLGAESTSPPLSTPKNGSNPSTLL